MFTLKRLIFGIFVLLLLFSGLYESFSVDPYTVRVVYFKPADVDPVPVAKYAELIKEIRLLYKIEMLKHGYDKTFNVELDNNGDVKVHTVNGRHNVAHYASNGNDTTQVILKVKDEIPFELNSYTNWDAQQNVQIYIIDGLNSDWHTNFSWGAGYQFSGNTIGGFVVINARVEQTDPHFFRSLIAHELAHAFRLAHNDLFRESFNIPPAIMGPLTFPENDIGILFQYEAKWFSKHYLFNKVHRPNDPPQLVGKFKPQTTDADQIKLQVSVKSIVGLHLCLLTSGNNTLGYDVLNGKEDIIDIDVPRHAIKTGDNLMFEVMDINGNVLTFHENNLQLPLPQNDIDTTDKFKFLTIRDESNHSLVPANNNIDDWVGWKHAGIFEKKPNGAIPQLPNWYLNFPTMNTWNSWFYSHANSRFVYDISNRKYNRFVADFYMPHPCNDDRDRADVEVTCLADGVEVYRSGILNGANAQNKRFKVDFPEDTKEFILKVTDAHDGITCDHFVFGNAMVLIYTDEGEDEIDNSVKNKNSDLDIGKEEPCRNCIDDSEENINTNAEDTQLKVNPKNKLTLQWGKLKQL